MVSSYRAVRENSNSINLEILKSSRTQHAEYEWALKSIIWARKWVVSGDDVRACTQEHRTQAHRCASQTHKSRAGRAPVSYGRRQGGERGSPETSMLCFSGKIHIKPQIYHFSQFRAINYTHNVGWPSPPSSPELSHLPNWNPISIYTSSSSASFQLFLMLINY